MNDAPDVLLHGLHANGVIDPAATVEWKSPLRSNAWAEYRDAASLHVLGSTEHVPELAGFWPKGGPQWDGLGVASDGTVLLGDVQVKGSRGKRPKWDHS
ncbi:MAG: hypothetical protein QGI33_01540, partial [Candidatus Brocadiia bacterium]|nr:hypothetical protein [Candidatus Brocadiia bacterium]